MANSAANGCKYSLVRCQRMSAKKAKKNYHHGDLRAALLEGALRLIKKRGARALSLREVAREAGVSHAAPYRHFADKEALFAAIALEGFGLLAQRLRNDRSRLDAARDFLESGWSYVGFAIEYPAHLQVMFGGVLERPEDCEGLPDAGENAFGELLAIIESGQQAGVIRAGDLRTLGLAAWSMMHGLAMLISEQGVVPAAQAREVTGALAALLFEGMQSEGLSRKV